MRNKDWLAALTGLAFLVLLIVGFLITGDPPDPADDSAQEIVDFYTDKDVIFFSGALVGLSAVALVFYGGYLRKVLTIAEGEGHSLPTVVLAGTIILATGLAIDSTIHFTLAETAEDLAPDSVATLSALYNNDYIPLGVGMMVFLLSAGISIVRSGALPKWLGWVAIVLGVVAITPIGFVSFIAGGLWIGITSVILSMRARAA